MSWATCYSGSNNIHSDYPALMSDGRHFTDWRLGAIINEKIKKQHNIKSNADYQQYLSNNSQRVMKENMNNAMKTCSNYTINRSNNSTNNVPFLYTSKNKHMTPYGYSNSDLKNIYLSRVKLNEKKITPFITLNSLNKL